MEKLLAQYEESASALERRISQLNAQAREKAWQVAAIRGRIALLTAELLDLRAAIRQMKKYLEAKEWP